MPFSVLCTPIVSNEAIYERAHYNPIRAYIFVKLQKNGTFICIFQKFVVSLRGKMKQTKAIMEEKKMNINLTPEVAEGKYVNLAVVSHSSSEFIIDFVAIMPGMQQGNVRSRVIMTPENAKRLLFAMQNNIDKYEKQFGKIEAVGGHTSTLPLSFSGGEA